MNEPISSRLYALDRSDACVIHFVWIEMRGKEEKKNSCIKSPFIPIWSLWELKAKGNFIHIPTILGRLRC